MQSQILKKLIYKRFCVRFTATHEWVKKIGNNKAQIGISDHAKHELGEVVYVDLAVKKEGDEVNAQEEICNLESVKAAAPVYTPISGKLVKKNDDALKGINAAPESSGWLWEIEIKDESEFKNLMTREQYNKSI